MKTLSGVRERYSTKCVHLIGIKPAIQSNNYQWKVLLNSN